MATAKKAGLTGAAALAALFAVNWMAGVYLGHPVVYCAARPFTPLIAPLFYWLWVASALVFVFYLFTTGISKLTLQAMAIGFLAHLIPMWLETLFRLGMSC